jgi:quinol monooxygenase YgiN
MVVVIVTMHAREGKEDELQAFLLALVVESRLENGNLRYDLLIGEDDPREFAIYAEWANAAALNAHLRSKPVGFAHARMPELADVLPRVVSYTGVQPTRTKHSGPTTRLNAADADPEDSQS